MRYSGDRLLFSANYTFYNQLPHTEISTNDYLNHNLVVNTGVQDKVGGFSYSVIFGYEFNDIQDGQRAAYSNYQSIPENGEHFVNLMTEFGFELLKDHRDLALDLNISLNQILAVNGLSYTPVPIASLGLRHRNGFYMSLHASRAYVLPDMTTAYGFGLSEPSIDPLVLPKDGLRTGFEIGVNRMMSRFYANATYSWLDKGFMLAEDSLSVVNSENVIAVSAELGAELKHIVNGTVLKAHTAFAFNYEIDARGLSPSTIPMYKWTTSLSAGAMNGDWDLALNYRLSSWIPNSYGCIDKTIRHYLDLHFRYKIFVFNVLNLANQSYRPIPNNPYSPYQSLPINSLSPHLIFLNSPSSSNSTHP